MQMMKETERCFVAICLEENIKNEIIKAQKVLAKIDCPVKWVEAENLHLTMKFLGDMKNELLPSVIDVLSSLTKNFKPMQFYLTQIGAFPSFQRPKIIWAGVKDENESIKHLVDQMEDGLFSLGLPKENREFVGHITVGRVKSLRNVRLLADTILQYPMLPTFKQAVKAITLYKSTLTAQGPIYEVVKNFMLRQET